MPAMSRLAAPSADGSRLVTGSVDNTARLSRAELTLQTATAVRDRVVQAYQDIIKMPI